MKKILLPLITSSFLLTGCWDFNLIGKYKSMCMRYDDSPLCVEFEANGFDPSEQYLDVRAYQLYRNFTYVSDGDKDRWDPNWTVFEKLEGDCEDISLTFISQLILDGVNPDNIEIVFSKGKEGGHIYARILMDSGEYYNFYYISTNTDIMSYKLTENTHLISNNILEK